MDAREAPPAAPSAKNAEQASARSWLPFEIGGLLLLPVAIYFLLDVEPFYRQNGVDPFIYVGYIENQADLIDRFGYTYFAVRFGLILPGRVLVALLGAVGGHFALRYLLAVLCASAVYLLGRRLGSRAAGLCGAVLCLSSPVFLRALMTVYADTTALPYLIAGCSCMLMPSGRRRWWAAAGGALFGLAVHSNPFVVSVIGVAFAARFALQLVRREWSAWSEYLYALVAAVAVTAAGALYYAVAFGSANILGPSIDALRTYGGASSSYFRSPTRDWLRFSLHLYMPLVTAAAMTAVVATRRRSNRSAARTLLAPAVPDVLIMLLAVEAFYFVQQFLLDGYALETFYYASYQFAFVALGVTVTVAELVRRPGFGESRAWAVSALALAIPFARNKFADGLELWTLPAVPVMVVLVTGLLLIGRRIAGLAVVGAIALVGSLAVLGFAAPRNVPLSPGQAFRYDPAYHLAIGNPSKEGLDWYEVASQLVDAAPKWDDDPGSLVFWYPNETGLLNSMQSTYLWTASTIQGGNPSLPNLTDAQKDLLVRRTPRHIMLLGLDPSDLTTGRSALEEIGLRPLDVVDRTLHAGKTTVYSELLTFDPASCDQEWRTWSNWSGLSPCA